METFHISRDMHRGMWYIDSDGTIWYSGGEAAERYVKLDGHDMCMRRQMNEEETDYSNTLLIDNKEYKKVTNGINVTVYSKVTQTIADSVGFDAENLFQIVR